LSFTLLSGNEAIAQGAWEAGVLVGAGYPGTPSTEILENLVRKPGVRCEWAPNEKVALEVGIGASAGGARALVTMKHVGLNVAADPLMTAAYTGVGAGLVIVVADDPGMHSSQNEQDSRHWGPFAHVPVLEPSDSADARAVVAEAFALSERLDLPVIVRSTTRLSHGKGLVAEAERVEARPPEYVRAPGKWVMMPGNAKVRRVDLDRRLAKARAESESFPLTAEELRDTSLGVICSGVVYEHVREALPDASTLKLGMTFPLPEERIRSFASKVDRLVVVEELDPYLRTAVAALGIALEDVDVPHIGELTPDIIAEAFGASPREIREPMDDLPPRPPMLCPGCPHRGVFVALRALDAVVTGDIGCYTLGALPPLSAMDTCVCMGASIGMAHGFELADPEGAPPVVAVIGDSTFAHSGITGLLDMVYNGGNATVVILDNRVTAMTGHQDNPFTGRTLAGDPAPEIDIEGLVRALGVGDARTVDPNLLKPTETALREAIAHKGVSVVIAKAPCILLAREHDEPYGVEEDKCNSCGECVRLGCPAISRNRVSRARIDASLCVGCRQCVQVCRKGAIHRVGRTCEGGGLS
jgi:indolepyruvate ferredoxin oxidoreductase, alpha subunit